MNRWAIVFRPNGLLYGLHSTGGRGVALYALLYAPTPLESPDEPHRFSNLSRKQVAPSVYEMHR